MRADAYAFAQHQAVPQVILSCSSSNNNNNNSNKCNATSGVVSLAQTLCTLAVTSPYNSRQSHKEAADCAVAVLKWVSE